MNGSLTRLQKCSAFILLIIGVGLVQLIQAQENYWRSQSYAMKEAIPVKQNISSRDFPKLDETTDSTKGSPVIAYHRSIHNTSWAITIPLFSFLLPTANAGDPVNIASQASYGVFAAIVVIIGFAIPILFNGAIPGARSLENNRITLNHLMHPGHLMNMVGTNFQNQIGIDPMQCLQKTICEANREPQNERYGFLAYPLQYLFPAKNVTDESSRSVYEIAAKDGKFTKMECRKKYECMFDVLDLASYCVSMYKRAKAKAAEEESLSGAEYSEPYSFR